jgi:SAM-dependent methyltransferase
MGKISIASLVTTISAYFLRVFPHSGSGRFCPVCGTHSKIFYEFGVVPRQDAMCPNCGSVERHRFIWQYLNQCNDFFDGKPKKMLHIAPEPCLEKKFREYLGDNYITADLFDAHAMVKMDITDIQYPDESFDVVYCSHVLEHVPDDRKALREFHRILTPNGKAILMVPIYDLEKTFEDFSITDPSDRLKVFGQIDHVRKYGHDFIDRLRDSGFSVLVVKVSDIINDSDIIRMAVSRALCGDIYLCMKN